MLVAALIPCRGSPDLVDTRNWVGPAGAWYFPDCEGQVFEGLGGGLGNVPSPLSTKPFLERRNIITQSDMNIKAAIFIFSTGTSVRYNKEDADMQMSGLPTRSRQGLEHHHWLIQLGRRLGKKKKPGLPR